MNKIAYMATVALTAMAISSCDDNTAGLGQSLNRYSDQLNATTAEYEVATRTVVADSVFALGKNCYLGRVRDPQTQADVKSEFATQFHLLDYVFRYSDENYVSRYNGMPAADSCDIIVYMAYPFSGADSLASIKMKVNEMSRTMEEGVKYYSNYSPRSMGMIRNDGIHKTKMFSYRNLLDTDSARASSTYLNNVRIVLNDPYTDKNGVTYNNYGTYIIRQHLEHPQYFANSYAFSHNVCPGFFFEVLDGYGLHAKVTNIGLRIYFRAKNDTATFNAGVTLAGTTEVLQTSLVTNDREAISKLAAETQHTYLKSPAGLFTEATLPVKEIMQSNPNDSLMAAKISFQRLNNQSDDSRTLNIPQTILMVQKDSLSNYFETNQMPDSKSSFYANFNYSGSTYSNTNTYNFTNICNLITRLWNNYKKGIAANANWEAEHPNWNKVLLVPVSYNSGSSTCTEHDMSLTCTRLVGGPDNPNEPVRISVVYGHFGD